MTPRTDTPLQLKAIVTSWVIAFCLFAAVTSVVHALMPDRIEPGDPLSWVLWPGIGLYALLNGSLLFGRGFGGAGEFIIVALGSASAWASLLVLLALVMRAFSPSHRLFQRVGRRATIRKGAPPGGPT